jgi:hypothetical protein
MMFLFLLLCGLHSCLRTTTSHLLKSPLSNRPNNVHLHIRLRAARKMNSNQIRQEWKHTKLISFSTGSHQKKLCFSTKMHEEQCKSATKPSDLSLLFLRLLLPCPPSKNFTKSSSAHLRRVRRRSPPSCSTVIIASVEWDVETGAPRYTWYIDVK